MQYEWSHWIQKAEFLPCYHFSILTMHIIILEPLVTKTRALNSKEIFTSTGNIYKYNHKWIQQSFILIMG